ncbi:MAG: hypothetical protein IJ574_05075, partial [Bacilli bacterium]|nr:hypothetical protein [Bacilli bacterium]
MNKKKKIIIASSFVILLAIGFTFARWFASDVQEGENEVASTCLDFEFKHKDNNKTGINLYGAFPLIDEEGSTSPGYGFQLVNKCDSYIEYTINMESLDTVAVANRIDINYVDAIIDNEPVNAIGSYISTDTLIPTTEANQAYDTRAIYTGILTPNATIDHTLHIWLDEDTPEDYMNMNYEGRLTVKANIMAYSSNAVNAVTYLTNLHNNGDTSLVYDDAIDTTTETNNNLRYVGANPNNYVSFNGELWRIIGVMKDVDGGTVSGDNATRIKIIKATDIGHYPYYEKCLDENMTYDSVNDKWTCSSARYNNNWPNSTANEILNDLYWNRKTHVPYNGNMYLKTGDQTALTWQD